MRNLTHTLAAPPPSGCDLVPPRHRPSKTAQRTEAEERSSAPYVRKTSAQKVETWHLRWDAGNWDQPANRGELGEWVEYCFSLADHLELKQP